MEWVYRVFGRTEADGGVYIRCAGVVMAQVAVAMGAHRDTLSGLAGMGDLMLTCMGGQSRNRTVGVRLGRGESIQTILEDRAKARCPHTAFTAFFIHAACPLRSPQPTLTYANQPIWRVISRPAASRGSTGLAGVSTRPAGLPHQWGATSCTRKEAPLTY